MKGITTRAYLALFRTPGALAFCLAGFLARSGGAMMGIGTVMMVSMLYGSYGWAGALTAANGLAWATGNAFLSRLSDRHGQARVMLPAAVISAIALTCLVIAAWLRAPVWALLAPTIIAGGLGGSPGAMVRARWNHALADPQQLHTAFALESTLDEVTYIIGPVVATALATLVHPTAGLMAPIVLGLTGGTWLFYGLRRTQPPVGAVLASSTSSSGTAQLSMPTNRFVRPDRFVLAFGGIVPLITVTALIGISFGAIDVATPAAASAWGAQKLTGLVLATMSFGSATAGLIYGARRWTLPLPNRFLIGVAAYAGLISLYPFAQHILVLALCGLLGGAAIAPSFTNANSLVNELVPKHRLTEGLSWIGTSIGVGASLGSSVAGQLIDKLSYGAGYWTAVCGASAALFVALGGAQTIRRHSMTGPVTLSR